MLCKVVIWGASGHALVVANILQLMGFFEVVGFLDDINPDRRCERISGLPVLGGKEQLAILKQQGISHCIVGFGDCEGRLKVAEFAKTEGFSLVTAIHPSAIIADGVTIGEGTVVVAGAVVNPCAKIGDNVIINTLASVDHECTVGDGVHICPGAHLAGCVTVGRATWIGIGVTVSDHIKIGSCSIIGAGAVVVSDIPDGVLAIGVPARVSKRNT